MDHRFNTHSIQIDSGLLQAIAAIDEFKGRWQALGKLGPEQSLRLKYIATIQSIGASTRIEGVALSDEAIEALLKQSDPTPNNRDEQEVRGYAETLALINEHFDALTLTEGHILQLHRDLLQFSSNDARHRGAYKTVDNTIAAIGADGQYLGTVLKTTSPFDTPGQMADLIDWTQQGLDKQTHHPLVVVAVFVVVFLKIHPFIDGNGRLSRLITHWLLRRAGYEHIAFASLEQVIESSKEDYYLALRRTQATLLEPKPNWQPWLNYFLRVLLEQKQKLETIIDREQALNAQLPPLARMLLEIIEQRGRLSVAEAIVLTGANRNTIKTHLQKLTQNGQIRRHGAGRGSWYGPS